METTVFDQDYDPEVDPKVIEKRQALFSKYVEPYLNMIYKLVMNYSYRKQNVEENYTEVLVALFRGIHTYDPSRSIHTWLHIVTKRYVYVLERKRKLHENKSYDVDIEEYQENIYDLEANSNSMNEENYQDFYSDDILCVLNEMSPKHRDTLLLQEAGYSLKEIVEIEYKKGTLKSRNIETIKSRLFIARKHLKKNLTRNGERKVD